MAFLLACLLSTAAGVQNLQHTPNPVTVGQTFMANSIDPVAGSTGWALTSHGISEKLFTVSSTGAIVPQIKARASVGTMTMTALDSTRVKIVSERATPVMEAVLANFIFTIFLQTNSGYVFTGPYKVETFVAGSRINLVPNTDYSQSSQRPLLVIKKYADGNALATALDAGQIDMAFHLPVQKLPALRLQSNITVKSFDVEYMYMMWHNMRRAPLSELNVRQAVDIAIDRHELTQALQGGSGTRSFFPSNTPRALPEAQLGQLNRLKNQAGTLLDQAGWTKDATTGLRQKNGVVLTLKLVAYPQRPGLVTMQPFIKAKLEALGITVNSVTTSGANWDELDAILASKDFDLLEWAQNTLPAGDPQYFCNDFFRSGQGSNQAGLNSTSVDSLLDILSNAATGQPRKTAADNAQKAILDLVPVSMLTAPA